MQWYGNLTLIDSSLYFSGEGRTEIFSPTEMPVLGKFNQNG